MFFIDDNSIHGIIIQLPLPDRISDNCVKCERPSKDVDGLTMTGSGALIHNLKTFTSCTPLGCVRLLNTYNIDMNGLNVTIIGSSNLVGLPMYSSFITKEDSSFNKYKY